LLPPSAAGLRPPQAKELQYLLLYNFFNLYKLK